MHNTFPDVFAVSVLIKPVKASIIFPHLWRTLLLHIFPRANFNRHRSKDRRITRAITIGEGIRIRTNESLNLRLYTRFRIGQIDSLYDTLRPPLHVAS